MVAYLGDHHWEHGKELATTSAKPGSVHWFACNRKLATPTRQRRAWCAAARLISGMRTPPMRFAPRAPRHASGAASAAGVGALAQAQSPGGGGWPVGQPLARKFASVGCEMPPCSAGFHAAIMSAAALITAAPTSMSAVLTAPVVFAGLPVVLRSGEPSQTSKCAGRESAQHRRVSASLPGGMELPRT